MQAAAGGGKRESYHTTRSSTTPEGLAHVVHDSHRDRFAHFRDRSGKYKSVAYDCDPATAEVAFASFDTGRDELRRRLTRWRPTRKKTAIVALARTLMVRCWAVLRAGTPMREPPLA